MNEYLQALVDESLEIYNREVKEINKRCKEPKNYKEAQDYAIVISNVVKRILRNVFKRDTFDNGELYYGTAKELIIPLLERGHKDIVEFSAKVQSNMYKEIKVGLKPVRVDFNKDRAYGIVKNITKDDEVKDD